jgi:ASC-1-like (ASCH) protein
LANFRIKKGDTLILEEWDPKIKKKTGRKIVKKVKNLLKFNPLEHYSSSQINKFGILAIEIK